MKKVLVSIANLEYVKYFLPLIKSARKKGNWDGDFCLIIPNDIDVELTTEMKFYGIHLFKAPLLPENPPIHFYKMYLFDEYFKKWEWVLYSDLDVLFLNPIKLKLNELDKNYLYTKKDAYSFMEHFYNNSEVILTGEQIEEKDKIFKKYGDGDAFQTCFLLYHYSMIENGYFKKLYRAYLYYYCYYELARTKWWDQSIFNIVFFEKWLDIGDEFVNRNPAMDDIEWDLSKLESGYMDTNNYTSTSALHFFSFFPPWDERNLKFYPIWNGYNKKIDLI